MQFWSAGAWARGNPPVLVTGPSDSDQVEGKTVTILCEVKKNPAKRCFETFAGVAGKLKPAEAQTALEELRAQRRQRQQA